MDISYEEKGKISQWEKYLLYKHKGLSSNPHTHRKPHTVAPSMSCSRTQQRDPSNKMESKDQCLRLCPHLHVQAVTLASPHTLRNINTHARGKERNQRCLLRTQVVGSEAIYFVVKERRNRLEGQRVPFGIYKPEGAQDGLLNNRGCFVWEEGGNYIYRQILPWSFSSYLSQPLPCQPKQTIPWRI